MKEQNQLIYYKKSLIPDNIEIDFSTYFVARRAEDILDPRCNKITMTLLEQATRKNNFEFHIDLNREKISGNSFYIENSLAHEILDDDFLSNVIIKIIIYPNKNENENSFIISNKIIFANTKKFFYNILNYDENGELFYVSSLNEHGDPEFKNSILPTNIYFYQSKMDNFHWRYIEPSDEELTLFFMQNQINPLLNEERDVDLTLMNFNFN